MIKRKLRDELLVEAWRELNADALGAIELELIRNTLARNLGERATPSPAAIARILAEQGVHLRHAEVLGVDTIWRTRLHKELFSPGELDFTSIAHSIESMKKLDDLLANLDSEGDETGEATLRELVVGIKADLESIAKARVDLGPEQKVAVEVVEWLTIWLQTPHIFSDWLDIRQKSATFIEKK